MKTRNDRRIAAIQKYIRTKNRLYSNPPTMAGDTFALTLLKQIAAVVRDTK